MSILLQQKLLQAVMRLVLAFVQVLARADAHQVVVQDVQVLVLRLVRVALDVQETAQVVVVVVVQLIVLVLVALDVLVVAVNAELAELPQIAVVAVVVAGVKELAVIHAEILVKVSVDMDAPQVVLVVLAIVIVVPEQTQRNVLLAPADVVPDVKVPVLDVLVVRDVQDVVPVALMAVVDVQAVVADALEDALVVQVSVLVVVEVLVHLIALEGAEVGVPLLVAQTVQLGVVQDVPLAVLDAVDVLQPVLVLVLLVVVPFVYLQQPLKILNYFMYKGNKNGKEN